MPTKKKAELPEEMTTPLRRRNPRPRRISQHHLPKGHRMTPVILCSPRLKQIRRKRTTLRPEFRMELSTNRRNPRPRQKSPVGARRRSRNRPSLTQNLKLHRMPRKTASMRCQNLRENTLIPNRACRCCPLTIARRSKRRQIRPRMICSTLSSRSEAPYPDRDDPGCGTVGG